MVDSNEFEQWPSTQLQLQIQSAVKPSSAKPVHLLPNRLPSPSLQDLKSGIDLIPLAPPYMQLKPEPGRT